MITPQKAWLVWAFADEREYLGNEGYPDVIENRYVYDSKVQNHRKIAEGDIVVISGKQQVLGIATIERIQSASAVKTIMRCPDCSISKITKRKRGNSDYRCRNGHVFSEPVVDTMDVTQYIADYGGSFVRISPGLSRKEALQACPIPSGQLSIRAVNFEQLTPVLTGLVTVGGLLPTPDNLDAYLNPYAAANSYQPTVEEYQPRQDDSRTRAMHLISERRGQGQFRNLLRQRYGDNCMISGCALMDIVEAAHISPYRGSQDQNPQNGLLLRADIHTLFDLDLLGIDPDSLVVRLHPQIVDHGYSAFEGNTLLCSEPDLPSRPALMSRWRRFRSRLPSG